MNKIWDECIEEARISYQQGDVPIGAVVVLNGIIITKAHNTRQQNHNILEHAEINAIIEASQLLNRWNLADCELYVTLKPCSMCVEVIKQARLSKVVYLLDKLDYKKEYSSTLFEKSDDLNGESEQTYRNLLSSFFQGKR